MGILLISKTVKDKYNMIHFSVKSKTKQTPNSDTEKILVVVGGAGAGGGVFKQHLFLTVLEAESPKSRQIRFFGKAHLLVCRWLLSVRPWDGERELWCFFHFL